MNFKRFLSGLASIQEKATKLKEKKKEISLSASCASPKLINLFNQIYMTAVIFMILVVGFYFIPTIVAYSNKKKNASAIMLLNLLLGWSIFGWIVALIWATTKD